MLPTSDISPLTKLGLKLLDHISYRYFENKVARGYFSGCSKLLDVGCGQGTFLKDAGPDSCGIDISPYNVAKCKEQNLNATQADAKKIPFPDNSFDGAYCSHVIQIYDCEGALEILREIRRVVKPNGIIVIACVPDNMRLYHTPENVRAYPPDALRRMVRPPEENVADVLAPTYSNQPAMRQKAIWLRRPALIELEGPRSDFATNVSFMLNLIQHKIGLRKYWAYNGYVIKLQNCAKD